MLTKITALEEAEKKVKEEDKHILITSSDHRHIQVIS